MRVRAILTVDLDERAALDSQRTLEHVGSVVNSIKLVQHGAGDSILFDFAGNRVGELRIEEEEEPTGETYAVSYRLMGDSGEACRTWWGAASDEDDAFDKARADLSKRFPSCAIIGKARLAGASAPATPADVLIRRQDIMRGRDQYDQVPRVAEPADVNAEMLRALGRIANHEYRSDRRNHNMVDISEVEDLRRIAWTAINRAERAQKGGTK